MKKASKEAIEIARFITDFLSVYVSIHISKSSNTLRSYQMALSLYLSFLEETILVTPESLCAKHFERKYVEKWLRWLADVRSCSSATCNVRLGSLRTFLKYMSSRKLEYMYLYEEATEIPLKKTPKTKVKGMSKAAVKALLATPDTSTHTGIRDLVLILVLYSTAARIDEVLSIKIKHIHTNVPNPYISIIGKGDKARTLYILPKVAAHIKKYMTLYHQNPDDPEAYLFYSKIKGIHEKMTQPAVDKRLKAMAVVANNKCSEVPEKLHAHQLRHAKASHWLEDGMNIVQISFLLGHESVETTMKYLDITLESERNALQTLEDETERTIKPKWKKSVNSLRAMCGI